jgi:hypothetical protein
MSEVLDLIHKAQDGILVERYCTQCNEPSSLKKGKELLDLLGSEVLDLIWQAEDGIQ